MATTHEYDIIYLSGTFLDSSFNSLDDRIKDIEGYSHLRADQTNDNKRAGVCTCFKEHLSILRRDNL